MAGSARTKELGQWWLRLLSPLSWPIAIRRLFLLTLPISVPLYVAAVVVLFVVMLALATAEPIIQFWSAPQQRLGSGYGYGYGSEKRRRKRRRDDDDADGPLMGL